MTGLAGLAPIIKTEAIAVVRIVGYFDESEDPSVLTIAGVFGKAGDWQSLEAQWAGLVGEYGMDEFKMSDCENRRGFWKDWANPSDRWAAQGRFIDLFAENPLPTPLGIMASVDLAAFPGRTTDEAWLTAFRMVLIRMVLAQAAFYLSDDRFALVFDYKNGVQGRASQLIEELRNQPEVGHLIGPVTFADSREFASLQMADMLAYEGRRVVTDTIKGGKPLRPQWIRMEEAQLLPGGGPRLFSEFQEDAVTGFVEIRERLR